MEPQHGYRRTLQGSMNGGGNGCGNDCNTKVDRCSRRTAGYGACGYLAEAWLAADARTVAADMSFK